MKKIELNCGELTYSHLRKIYAGSIELYLSPGSCLAIQAAVDTLQEFVESDRVVYGVNTGFGYLAKQRIEKEQLLKLQHDLVMSHAAGVGPLFADSIVRLILILKANSLGRGYSGVRVSIVEALLTLYNKQIYPCIPSKGSVGASGDLAPLAHLASVLIGIGDVSINGKITTAQQGLAIAGISLIELEPKEGLSLLNGTQVSTALIVAAILQIEKIFSAAIMASALSCEAIVANQQAFDERIHVIRGNQGQKDVAGYLRELLARSEILQKLNENNRVQDPYSIRCQPQVMGACLQQIRCVAKNMLQEVNAVTDNPLIFAEQNNILSGGNFHAEPVAMAADNLALAFAEIGSISERRIALMIDPNLSGLPAFLTKQPGLHSGMMMAHVTAASLVSENKLYASPASVDSIPTSDNQEDHVSMATFAARRLLEMAENTANIIAIELLSACQAIDFRQPLKPSPVLLKVYQHIRQQIPFYDDDRLLAIEIEKIKQMVLSGELEQFWRADIL